MGNTEKPNKQLMFKMIRDFYGLERNSELAKFFGISDQNAHGWANRDSLDFEKIYAKCPEISPDWLLSGGEGEMLRKNCQVVEGDNNNVAGRDLNTANSEVILKLTDSLLAEQEMNKKSQAHIDALLDLLKKDTI